MSSYVRTCDITVEQKQELEKRSVITVGDKTYRFFQPSIDESVICFPFALSAEILGKKPNQFKKFSSIDVEFVGELRDYQRSLRKDAVKRMNETGSSFLQLHCGAGKTCLAINIATKIRMKTLIIVHRVVLMKQWVDSIKQFTNTENIQIIKANEPINPNMDFYIINIVNVFKHTNSEFFDIGFVIFDECHIMGSVKAINAFKLFTPRYALGLSATPTRNDGMHNVIELHLGSEFVIKKMQHPHKVYKISHTSENNYADPSYVNSTTGKLEWTRIINEQAMDRVRNDKIVLIIEKLIDRVFIVLCKRVEQCYYIQSELKQRGVMADVFTGTSKNVNYEARVLISTFSKTGEGFDHPNLDTLIVATDVKTKVEQYHGRIFRKKDNSPIVIDIVDNFGPFHAHFTSRKKYYLESGGKMCKFEKDYPYVFGVEQDADTHDNTEIVSDRLQSFL